MHAILLTLIAVGADAGAAGYSYDVVAGESQCGCESGCDQCGGHGKGGLFGRSERGRTGWFGAMPQTCYAPRYGCYPGNNRHMHRYPAFHATYYRKPYNYRNMFDYPWHAQLHEPTSMFSYNVAAEEAAGDNLLPPLPPTSAGYYRGISTQPAEKPAGEDSVKRQQVRTASSPKKASRRSAAFGKFAR